MLGQRLLTALLGMPVLLVASYLGGLPYAAVITVLAIVGVLEALRLFGVTPGPETAICGLVGVAGWLIGPMLGNDSLTWPVLALFAVALLTRQAVRFPAVTNQETAAICFASTYLGLSLAHFLMLRAVDGGFALTLVAFLLTWVFDSTAYFVGMRLGKHRLAPRLSPGKSWEGAIGGSIAALVFAAAPFPFWSATLALRLGAAVAVIVFGQIGDLAESAMKRHAQVKDSGSVLPGHGGMLDRFDSLMLSLPAVYYLFRLLPGGLGR